MAPLFSIILPTYNRAYVLWRSILSIIAQTEERWELIVVNDGSTDRTLRLLEEFGDPRIRVVTTTNQGPSAARNRGIKEAQAPFIAYLDSDNRWLPEFLAVMNETIERSPKCVFWHCGSIGTWWERGRHGTWKFISEKGGPAQPISYEGVWQMKAADTNCMVHRASVAEVVGGWDEQCRWVEDWDFFLRVYLAYPGQVQHVPDVLVEYRQVHGEGADGICGEAREDRTTEVAGRRYLLEKWQHHPDFAAGDKLSVNEESLKLHRA
ncbi:MAG: glycosyltransferase family A protein [Chloroflexota bacterium]